jgi:Trp operon repressor
MIKEEDMTSRSAIINKLIVCEKSIREIRQSLEAEERRELLGRIKKDST